MEKYTLELALKLKEEYDNGATQPELDKKYNIDSYWLFKKYDLKCRKSSETRMTFRKSSIKLNWQFEKVENEIEAYIIGLILSDGYHNDFQAEIKQSIKDEPLVKKLRDYFSKDIKLCRYKNFIGFKVSSKIACENLNKLGINNRKTFKELHIPKIKENLIRHFIRGYFDGDGTIFVCNVKGVPKYLKGNICSPTENILKEIQAKLLEYGIESTINVEKRKGKRMRIPDGECICKTDMYRLFFRKKESIRKLYYFLYKDSTIYLDRKKNVFDNNYFLW